jgi:tyrosyl-tRNA synthetase
MNEIQILENRIKAGENPRDVKMILADEIVKMYHGEKASKKAQEYFVQIFNKKEVAQEGIVEVSAEGKTLEDILVQESMVSSKSDLRRLVESGAVSNFESKEILSFDQVKEIAVPAVYKIGKSRIIRIV